MPRPFSTVITGKMKGSASEATNRSTTCMTIASTPRLVPITRTVGSRWPSAPSCTSAIEPPTMMHATSTSTSSRLRSFAGARSRKRMVLVKVLRAPASIARPADGGAIEAVASLLLDGIGESFDDALGVVEVARADGVFDGLPGVTRQVREPHARLFIDAVQRDRADVLLHAAIDRHGLAVGAHVVERLGPAVAGDDRDDDADGDDGDGH